jgi:DNA polymerase-3 subunit gamma/tau
MSIPDGQQAAPAPKQFARKTKAASESPAPRAEPAPEPVTEPKPASPPPVRPPSDPVVEAPPPVTVTGEANAAAGPLDAAAVRRLWPTVREKVRNLRRPTDVMLDGATVLAVEGETLVLSHPSAPLAKRIVEQRNSDILREALKDALGVDWKIRCEAGTGTPPPAAPEPDEPVAAAPAPPQRDEEEESMLAEAGTETSEVSRRDPEEAALELLQNELGARRIDGA